MLLETIPVGALATNCYLVGAQGREDCVLIDAGDDPQRLLAAVKKSGRRLAYILLTHGHFDHMLGARQLREATGARIFLHAQDANCLADARCNLADDMPVRCPFEPFAADGLFDGEEEAWQGAGLEFSVLHTPGHTPGGVCYLDRAHGWLFSGDTLFYGGYGRFDFPGGSMALLRDSLARLSELDPGLTVLPGHGRSGLLRYAIGGIL